MLRETHYTQRMAVRLCFLILGLKFCRGWIVSPWPAATRTLTSQQRRRSIAALGMVRNIDYPEAIVLYGPELSLETSGLEALLEECQQMETPVLAIGYSKADHSLKQQQEPLDRQRTPMQMIHYAETCPPPNPKDLWQAIHSIDVQPRPFGGSSGFGAQQLLEPPRPPLPSRVVVFGTTLQQTQAARAAGMRVLSLVDNDLADAVLLDFDNLWLQDIATPGSFWLNPPTPRDDHGDKVNVESLIQEYAAISAVKEPSTNVVPTNNGDGTRGNDGDMDEDELLAILADIAPL